MTEKDKTETIAKRMINSFDGMNLTEQERKMFLSEHLASNSLTCKPSLGIYVLSDGSSIRWKDGN